MREILFRGRRLEGGSWGEGYFAQTEAASYIWDERSCEWLDVDPDTVGQYTGLKDTNGRKIFEGDIIERSGTTLRYEVVFEDRYDRAYFGVKNEDETWPFPVAIPSIQMEVIGNIWDNPELLEAEP